MVLSGKGCSHTLRTPMLINSSQLNTWQYPARIPGLVLPLFMICFFWELSWGIWYWNIYIWIYWGVLLIPMILHHPPICRWMLGPLGVAWPKCAGCSDLRLPRATWKFTGKAAGGPRICGKFGRAKKMECRKGGIWNPMCPMRYSISRIDPPMREEWAE